MIPFSTSWLARSAFVSSACWRFWLNTFNTTREPHIPSFIILFSKSHLWLWASQQSSGNHFHIIMTTLTSWLRAVHAFHLNKHLCACFVKIMQLRSWWIMCESNGKIKNIEVFYESETDLGFLSIVLFMFFLLFLLLEQQLYWESLRREEKSKNENDLLWNWKHWLGMTLVLAFLPLRSHLLLHHYLSPLGLCMEDAQDSVYGMLAFDDLAWQLGWKEGRDVSDQW